MKSLKLNSIQSRMLSGFLFLTVLILLLAVGSLYILDQSNRMTLLHGKINQLQVYMLNIIKTDNDFFDLETMNEDYFVHHRSHLLDARDSLYQHLRKGITEVVQISRRNKYPVEKYLHQIDSLTNIYNTKFQRLETLSFLRGFKDFGLEGTMRLHAHELEKPASGLSIFSVLTLRRNEKDFFLRHDTTYIFKVNNLSKQILRQQSKRLPSTTVQHLRAYQAQFNQLAAMQKEIGLTGKDGLRHDLNVLTSQLSLQYYTWTNHANELSSAIRQRALIFYLVMIGGAILFSILWAYWISRRLTEPITRISQMMKGALQERNRPKFNLLLPGASREIKALTQSFVQLMDRTDEQMEEIQKQSKLLKKRNHELKKVNKELDSFLYSTAHDLRSPLSSLHGLINLIRYENKQEALLPFFAMMHESVTRQEDFISQIVNYSKNKKLSLVVEQLDLAQLIDDIFQNLNFVVGANLITRQVDISEEIPFYSDKTRVQTLFNNLISNAIKYADHRKKVPVIRIQVRVTSEEAVIEFIDNGLGIETEHQSRIFDMFYRANYNSKGSGLGLFIFRKTLQKLKGSVLVESQIEVGTKFSLRIPNLTAHQHVQVTQEHHGLMMQDS